MLAIHMKKKKKNIWLQCIASGSVVLFYSHYAGHLHRYGR